MEMNRAEGGEPIMLHIAICDDQADQIQKIREASEKYFQNRKEHVDYQTFENAFAFIEAVDKGDFFDIVLLDVCMPGILGTDVAGNSGTTTAGRRSFSSPPATNSP